MRLMTPHFIVESLYVLTGANPQRSTPHGLRKADRSTSGCQMTTRVADPRFGDARDDAGVADAGAILRMLFGPPAGRNFAVRFWDGSNENECPNPSFTLNIRTPFALRAALMPPFDLSPGRAFVEGWIDVDGDIEATVDAFMRAFERFAKRHIPTLIAALMRLPKPPPAVANGEFHRGGSERSHSKNSDARAITFHYDRSVEFYRTFLDELTVYSCAYFDDGVETLDHAQLAKIDLVLKKLRLLPGETLLDIGSGWGALVLRAAEKFGAKVLGITLSREQHAESVRRIAVAGLGERASVELCDYRDLRGRTFDKIVSVGMVEHVGRERLDDYFSSVYRALRPGGLFLNHGIGQLDRGTSYRASGFIARYVFPEGDLLSISDMPKHAERAAFEVRDVENLREHYTRTIRAWLHNIETRRTSAIAATDERTYRIWRLYLAGCAQGFARGRMALYQSLLAKPLRSGEVPLPRTRRDLYRPLEADSPFGRSR